MTQLQLHRISVQFIVRIHILYSGLISRGEIFVDWIVKTFHGYILDYN